MPQTHSTRVTEFETKRGAPVGGAMMSRRSPTLKNFAAPVQIHVGPVLRLSPTHGTIYRMFEYGGRTACPVDGGRSRRSPRSRLPRVRRAFSAQRRPRTRFRCRSAMASVRSTYPGKRALIRLTTRPPQLETPFSVFNEGLVTPNDAFFVRYHLAGIRRPSIRTHSVSGSRARSTIRFRSPWTI